MRSTLCALLGLTLLLPACSGAGEPAASDRTPAAAPYAPGNYIINLYDAFGRPTEGLTHAFGFAALVRYNGSTILFDSGGDAEIFKRNVETLGIDLRTVDYAVASHAHFDHINGLDYLLEVNPKVKIYFPADVYWGAPLKFDVSGREPEVAEQLPADQRYFGGAKTQFTFQRSGRFRNADVVFVKEHTEIAPGVTLIATKSPYLGYFSRYPTLNTAEKLMEGSGEVKTL
ncbi:MAG: MBL fold metallo-hydrolase, partial [Planctomycetota bacterium]